MEALFIGHAYTDITVVTDHMPTGDEKYVGENYAFGVGGNAVVAAFTAAKFGINTDLIVQVGNDRLSDIFLQQCAKRGVRTFTRTTKRSSMSVVMPNNGKRAVLRCRDTDYLEEFPRVGIKSYSAIHVDSHQGDAALHYVKEAREQGILTSLDGGTIREKTEEILDYIDIAVVSELFCEKLGKSVEATLQYLLDKGVKVAAVTQGDKGFTFTEGGEVTSIPAINIPKTDVIDSTGAGDIFHGSYIASYLKNPQKSWKEHFCFARAASALSVQKLGTEASIPLLGEVEDLNQQNEC